MRVGALTAIVAVFSAVACGASGAPRHVGHLPNGTLIEIRHTQRGELCVIAARLMTACGPQLTDPQPITFTVLAGNPALGTAPVAFGVALDGIRSVSLVYHDARLTVPVRHRFFVFQGRRDAANARIVPVAVTLADGRIQALSLPH